MWNQFESSIRTIQGSQKPAEPNGLSHFAQPFQSLVPALTT